MTDIEKNSINAINKFFYYKNNFNSVEHAFGNGIATYVPEVIEKASWTCDSDHIAEKFIGYRNRKGNSQDAFDELYANLDTNNRIAMLSWILENYSCSNIA